MEEVFDQGEEGMQKQYKPDPKLLSCSICL
jgi:hypothetical protein